MLCNQSNSVLREHLVIGHFGISLFFIGDHKGSKLNEMDLITRLDQPMRAVHGCYSWLFLSFSPNEKLPIELFKGNGAYLMFNVNQRNTVEDVEPKS